MIHFEIFWPLNKTIFATLIFSGKKIEQLTWSTFSSPFHWTVWLCLLFFSIGISTVLWTFHNYSKIQKKMNSIEAFCIVSSSIFGLCIRDANDTNSKASERLILLVVFICGSIFYYTYCGFLTSSLAVPNENLPFGSPEELLNTNYR